MSFLVKKTSAHVNGWNCRIVCVRLGSNSRLWVINNTVIFYLYFTNNNSERGGKGELLPVIDPDTEIMATVLRSASSEPFVNLSDQKRQEKSDECLILIGRL